VKQSSCRRLWEVEAARDGRLSGVDLRSFELHSAQCKTCADERRQLDRLANALRVSGRPADEIALRRGRERILEEADGNGHVLSRHTSKLSMLLVAAVGSLLATIAYRNHAPREPIHLVDVVASPGARWEQNLSGGVEEVRLKDGVFSLSVHRKPSDPRVAVVVPDGTIDDIGTEFQVTVAGGETRGVVVRQGAVMLKLAGREPLLLQTRSSWSPAPPALATTSSASPPQSVDSSARQEMKPPPPVQSKKRAPARHDASPPQSSVLSTEDLAYLRIVALRREGRSDEARVAAAEYLHSFPEGFRRPEVLAFQRAQR
jgi:hypothetical protein